MTEDRDDRDSPWKEALDRYLEPCLRLLFPEVHALIDWSRGWEPLDAELQQVVRDAETGRRHADKLHRVWLKDGSETRLSLHVEVQGQVDQGLPERIYVYRARIRDRYGPPVIDLVVLADDDPDWRPTSFVEDLAGCKLELTFPTVKLLDLERDHDLAADPNPFALVVRAHLGSLRTRKLPLERLDWKWSLTRALYARGYTREEVLELYRFVDWLLQLPPELERVHQARIDRWEEEQSMSYITSAERIGIEQGRAQTLLTVLSARFGAVPDDLARTVLERARDGAAFAELARQAATTPSLAALRTSLGLAPADDPG